MLSNAYFLATFRFDTAENEPAKNLQKKNAPAEVGRPFLGGASARLQHALLPLYLKHVAQGLEPAVAALR